jgi:hypothetical protein
LAEMAQRMDVALGARETIRRELGEDDFMRKV